MLMLWAITVFFTASDLEEGTSTGTQVHSSAAAGKKPRADQSPGHSHCAVRSTWHAHRGAGDENGQMDALDGTLRGLSSRLDVVASDEFVGRFTKNSKIRCAG